jgi:hypothetical protein
LTRLDNGPIATCVYRKPSNTNNIVQPQSCQLPQISISSFKGEPCRAYCLCSSPASLKAELDNILNIFKDNGHNRVQLEAIVKSYSPPGGLPSSPSSSATSCSPSGNQTQPDLPCASDEDIVASLFITLPLAEPEPLDLQDDALPQSQILSQDDLAELQRKPTVCLPFIPDLSAKLKHVLNRAGCKTFFKSGLKLSNLLCAKNKTRPPR